MPLNPVVAAQIWQQRYEEAAAFYATHRRLPKQRECAVGKWLAKQREQARANTLSSERAQLLARLPGFAVDQRGRGHADHLAAVTAFANRHGRLPRRGDRGMEAHAQWVKDVRAGKVTLSPEHQQVLDEAGFSAHPSRDQQEEFLEHYRTYRQETSYRRVPVGYVCTDGYPLGMRCHRRRQAARAGELSPIHRQQLDDADFPWHDTH